jgi:1-aminocyclopropane-1-carboxylate deaminase/D-cysteine desulfhydrase-like pyridoxal-dependent ACC family enzyme
VTPLSINDIEQHANKTQTILQEVELPGLPSHSKVYLKREDLIHHEISGNKWYKLKYNLIEASSQGCKTILTFGGAYSNHIHAVASAGRIFGFNTIGIIRGEEHFPLNPTLEHAVKCGMKLVYLDRTTYRKRNEPEFQNELKEKFGNVYVVPEGGTNSLAVKGASEIMTDINIDCNYICTAVGTGGTLSGLICGANGKGNVLGFSILKGGSFLIDEVANHVKNYSGNSFTNWKINLDYHFGGYAKINSELVKFIHDFESLNGIPLDPIYTGKMLYGISDLIKQERFDKHDVIVAIHTGGLQGVDGMREKMER